MENNEISTDEAVNRAKKIFEYDEIYIVLSFRNANLNEGVSVPYIAKVQDKITGLIAFSKEEYAKEYLLNHNFEILDGILPIGKIEKKDRFNNIINILLIAKAMGIKFLDFNVGANDNSIGAYIEWILNVSGIDGEMSMLLTSEQYNNIIQGAGKTEVKFNPISFLNFYNPYEVDDEEAKKLLRSVFAYSSVEDFREHFTNEQSIFQNCYVMDYIVTSMIPHATEINKKDDIAYFESVAHILGNVIKNKIFESENVFTLLDPETGNLINRNGIIYLLYTDRFKYMGQYLYKKLENKDEIMNLIKESQAKKAVVTDGPHGMAVIELGGWNDSKYK